jgi:hypothetical protein
MAKKSSNTIAAVKAEDDWQVEDDLRTLMRCKEIESDPKRMAKVQAMAKKRMLEMAYVASEGKDD